MLIFKSYVTITRNSLSKDPAKQLLFIACIRNFCPQTWFAPRLTEESSASLKAANVKRKGSILGQKVHSLC